MKILKFSTLFLTLLFSLTTQSIFGLTEESPACYGNSSYRNYQAAVRQAKEKGQTGFFGKFSGIEDYADNASEWKRKCDAERKVIAKEEEKRRKPSGPCKDCLDDNKVTRLDFYKNASACKNKCVGGEKYLVNGRLVNFPRVDSLSFDLSDSPEEFISKIIGLTFKPRTTSSKECYETAGEGEIYHPTKGEIVKDCSSEPNAYLNESGDCTFCNPWEFLTGEGENESCVAKKDPCDFSSFPKYSISQADLIRRGEGGGFVTNAVEWGQACVPRDPCDFDSHEDWSFHQAEFIALNLEETLAITSRETWIATCAPATEPCDHSSFTEYRDDAIEYARKSETNVTLKSEQDWNALCKPEFCEIERGFIKDQLTGICVNVCILNMGELSDFLDIEMNNEIFAYYQGLCEERLP